MRKTIKEIDFSQGKPNKFYGRRLIIVGGRRAAQRQNPSDRTFQFVNRLSGRSVEIRAANKKEARTTFLEMFNLKRMPAGFEISEVKLAA